MVYYVLIPCGLVARIRRSHRRGRGSIPRTGVCLRKIGKNAKMHQGFCYNLLNPSSGPTIVHKTQKSILTHKKAVKNSLSDVESNLHFPSTEVTIPCGLVARIRRFHRRGRGSIPRKGVKQIFRQSWISWKFEATSFDNMRKCICNDDMYMSSWCSK